MTHFIYTYYRRPVFENTSACRFLRRRDFLERALTCATSMGKAAAMMPGLSRKLTVVKSTVLALYRDALSDKRYQLQLGLAPLDGDLDFSVSRSYLCIRNVKDADSRYDIFSSSRQLSPQ